jgi:hypothetical protein
MDVGIKLIRGLDRMGWDQLEDDNNPKTVVIPHYYETVIANHWWAARKGDAFIRRWHELFTHLWQDKHNYEGLSANPLLAFAASMINFSKTSAMGFNWEFKVGPEVVWQYVTQSLAFARLALIEEPGADGFNGPEYVRDHVLHYKVFEECWPIEKVVGFPGHVIFKALSTQVNADPSSKEYQVAYEMTWKALTSASMQKITHGKNLTKTPALGSLWDLPENAEKDIEPGTFAELLRYGAVNFRQTREDLLWVTPEMPTETIKKGLYEP